MKSNLGILSSNINSLDFLSVNRLYDYFNFYAIASRNIEDSKAISSNFNFKKYYGSYEELVKDPNIDFVINFLPNSIKFEYSYLLLKAQKKVITSYPVFNSIKDIIYVEDDLIYRSQYLITIADDTTTLTKSVTKLDVAVGTWAVDAADDLTHSPMMISRSLTKFKFKIINEKGEIISQPTTRSALLSAQIKVISLEAEQIIRKDNSNLTKTDLASATFFLKNLSDEKLLLHYLIY